jgi:hypothetical protein
LGGQPLFPPAGGRVGAGGRLLDAGGRVLCGDGGPLSGLDTSGAGASNTGADALGRAQTAPDTGLAQPAADSTAPPVNMTTSANNPRVRTPLPPPFERPKSIDRNASARSPAAPQSATWHGHIR